MIIPRILSLKQLFAVKYGHGRVSRGQLIDCLPCLGTCLIFEVRSAMSRSAEKLIRVFVYGTLKRGEPNHHWLTAKENGLAKFVGEATTVQQFPLVVGTRYNIPFLLNKPGCGHNIKGEVYEVNEMMFTRLDVLEDYPQYYDREIQPVILDQNNEEINCWLYLIRKFPEKLLGKTHLRAYHNTENQPYCERCNRDPNIKSLNDMDY